MENSNWKDVKLGDIAEVKSGKRVPKGKLLVDYETAHPYIRITDLGNKWIKKNGLLFVRPEDQLQISRYIVNKGDVILSIVGSIGIVARISDELDKANLTENCVKLLVSNDEIIDDFLYYFLTSSIGQEEIRKRNVGSTQPKLPIYNIKSIEIQLPPLPEQKAIASVLSSLDDKIDLLHQQNQTLEALAETLFRQWFIERCPEPVEGEAKEDWEDCTIEDLAIHSKLSVHPNRNPDTLYHHYSIPAFDANKKPVVELGKEIQSNKYKVEENSILFSKLNPHKDKRVWLIQDNVEEHAICSTELQVVKPKDKDYLYFIYGWLTNSIYYNEIASGVGGTSGSHQRIEPKAIFTAPCVKIEKDIILQYNSHAEPLFKKQFENQQQIQTLTQLRDTLLPKLMSGEVRVKV